MQGCVATSGDVRGAYARQSKIEERVDTLTSEVEGLKSQLEGAGHEGSGDAGVRMLYNRITRLEQAYNVLAARVARLERGEAAVGPLPSRNALRKPGYKEPSSRIPPPPPVVPFKERGLPPSSAGEATTLSPDRTFGEAYRELSRGQYEGARSLFKEFIAKNEDSPRLPDAYYWIAESYYREGRFEEAILEFQTFIDHFPHDKRTPRAYLKQGLSLININRQEEAKLFLQTLVDKYPDSEEAIVAKDKLKELAMKKGKY